MALLRRCWWSCWFRRKFSIALDGFWVNAFAALATELANDAAAAVVRNAVANWCWLGPPETPRWPPPWCWLASWAAAVMAANAAAAGLVTAWSPGAPCTAAAVAVACRTSSKLRKEVTFASISCCENLKKVWFYVRLISEYKKTYKTYKT